MADKKISQLPPATLPLTGTEELPIVQSGVTKKATVDDVTSGLAPYPAAGIPVSTGTAWGSSLPVPLTPANGGTGATTLPANNVLLGNGTSAVLAVAPGSSGNVLTSNGTTWQSTAPIGGGTVTSVGGTGTVNGISLSGTVTSSGSLTLGGALTGVNLGTQVTGTLPVANGGTGNTSYTNGQLLIGNSTGNTLTKSTLTAGSGINIINGTGSITIESTAGGGGTVTSVAATVPAFLSVTGSPITTSGTLAIGYSGTALPIANGGTSATTANGAVNALLPTQTGNSGKVLGTNGTDTSWVAVGGSGTVTSVAATVPSFLSVTGSPITASGTLAIDYSGTALPIANGGTGATTAGGALTALGAYPDTNPNGYTTNTGTVTSVDGVAGTGISITGGPITSSGSLTITNTAPDQVVSLTGSGSTTVTGTYPNFTISSTSGAGTVTSVDVSGGTTGLTTSGGPVTSSGTITLAGTLAVANGGTGATTLTGVVIGNGTSAFTVKTNPTGAFVGTTDTQTLTNKTLTDPAIIGTILEDIFTITDGAAFEIDPGNGSIQLITLGANRTPKATNFVAGEAITLMVDDGTAYAITWTDATWGGTGVIWETDAGTAPTLSTTGYTTIILWKVASQVYGARVGNA